MQKNKGFTLVELLAVILILGALAVLIVPSIVRFLNQGYDEYNSSLEKQVILAAKNYVIDHSNDEFSKLSVRTLLDNNYLSENVVDKSGNSCDKSYVVIKDENYTACLICNDKLISTNNVCK